MFEDLLRKLENHRDDLDQIASQGFDAPELSLQKLDRWKDRLIRTLGEEIGSSEVQKFEYAFRLTHTVRSERELVRAKLTNAKPYLSALIDDVQRYPENYRETQAPVQAAVENPELESDPRGTSNVFIVHGHDELNLRRLKDIVKDEFGLDPIIMMARPGSGRTLIEKFEQEASGASYALVLMTPDDMIAVKDSELFQSRPNVLFELGWFYGKLGRSRVCIVFKEGTQIPSDLDGVERVEFKDSPEEKVAALRKELEKAEMI